MDNWRLMKIPHLPNNCVLYNLDAITYCRQGRQTEGGGGWGGLNPP